MYVMESAPGPRTVINGREFDYFSGCGYYGLGGHPQLAKAACEAVKKYGTNAGTSREIFGRTPVLLEVEKRAAEFFETESSLYYVSGYLGNIILLKGLDDQYDVIFADEKSHYSVKDAIAQMDKGFVEFAHLDVADLKKKLQENLKPSQRPLLICDGIFSSTGAISPIPDYIKVLEEFGQPLICVDDAHAVGVIGKKGQGTFEYFGLKQEGLYFSGTFSKAFSGHGGIIPDKTEFIEKLKKKSKIPYASGGTPIPTSAATAKAIEILHKNPGMREKLWDNVIYTKKQLRNLGFDIELTPVPIISLRCKEGLDLEALQAELFKKGMLVSYRAGGSYASVPEGGAIRIAVFSNHTRQQIDRLVEEIKKAV